jgi:uncharacterized DUF497 family protein
MDESFEWDEDKNLENQAKHGVSFEQAQQAFLDPHRVMFEDELHSTLEETRYFCIAQIPGGIISVRFTYRGDTIRIFGAGFWRKYRKLYLKKDNL